MADIAQWIVTATSSTAADTAVLNPTGGDDTAQMIAALTTFGTAPRPVIKLGAGTFKWTTSVPKIARNVGAVIYGLGRGATTVQLSAAAPRLVDPNKIQDYDTFSNIEIHDLTIDAAAIGNTTNSVVFGCVQAGLGGAISRINLSNIRVWNVDVINLPAPLAGAGNPEAFSFRVTQAAGDPALMTLTDIYFQNCRAFGGRIGFMVGATGTPNAAFVTFIDRVYIQNCYHDTGIIPSAAPAGSWGNFDLIANGVGGRDIYLEDSIGKGSNDVGLEIDGALKFVARDVDIYDCWNNAFLITSFQTPARPATQKHHLIRCNHYQDNVMCGAGSFFAENLNGNPLGEVIFEECLTYLSAAATVPSGATIWNYAIGQNASLCALRRAVFKDCKVILGDSATAFTSVGAMNCYFANLSPNSIGGVLPSIVFEGANSMTINGTQGAGAFTVRGICLNQGSCEVEGGGGSFVVDQNMTSQTAGATSLMNIGLNAGSTIKGILPRLVVKRFAGGDTTPKGIALTPPANLTIQQRLTVARCDFSGLPVGATDISRPSTQGALVRFTDNVYLINPKLPAAVSATTFATAAFTTGVWNQYIGSYDTLLQLLSGSGAAITAVDLSPDNGTTVVNVWTQASGAMTQTLTVDIQTGWYVRITFATTQPTCSLIPQST